MKILLLALSAQYVHKTLAPWCLKAYLDDNVAGCTCIVCEYTINDDVNKIVNSIYLEKPDIVGFSCYIWNRERTFTLISALKKFLPNCVIVAGGPEVSFEEERAHPAVDYIVQGPGEQPLARLVQDLMAGKPPRKSIIKSSEDNNGHAFACCPSPFTQDYFASFYRKGVDRIESQLLYYESTRGCPFSCSYCLSSATRGVEVLPLGQVREELALLVAKGAKTIKFVDRTFNADTKRACAILEYVASLRTGCVFHFEAAADLFDEAQFSLLEKMPLCRVQFEIGIQSVHPETLEAVHRKTDIEKALGNIAKLVRLGNCHVHVDLIAGLPLETKASLIEGVNRCLAVKPAMLQLGFLKLLKGSPLRKESARWGYVYNDAPPYEVFRSDTMRFDDIIEMREVEEAIDKYYNSGLFTHSLGYAQENLFAGAYDCFRALAAFGKTHSEAKTSLKNAYTLLLDFLLCAGADRLQAEHLIKLDCLTYDAKGMLPDAILPARDKQAEWNFKRRHPAKASKLRVEYFPFDGRRRVFLYDVKNPLTKAYPVIIF